MTEQASTGKKIASPELAKETWDAMDHPSCRAVREKLIAAGYVTPSFKTIANWAKSGKWVKPKGRKKSKFGNAIDDAVPVLTGDPRSKAEDIVNAVMKVLPSPEPEPEPKVEQPKTEQADKPNDGYDEQVEAERDRRDARERLRQLRDAITGNVTDEALLSAAARQTLQTATIIGAVLAEMAPALISAAPEAVGKLQLAVAESLAAAGEPFDRIGAARERAMKTVGSSGALNGEIIPPGGGHGDPLADSLSAFKKKHAA